MLASRAARRVLQNDAARYPLELPSTAGVMSRPPRLAIDFLLVRAYDDSGASRVPPVRGKVSPPRSM